MPKVLINAIATLRFFPHETVAEGEKLAGAVAGRGRGRRLASTEKDGPGANMLFYASFRPVKSGTRLDCTIGGSRRFNGVRNFRQALASPYLVHHHSRFGAARSEDSQILGFVNSQILRSGNP